ncbi:tail protein X [Devosia ginsengisoli]|uniref:tail protein X n=1 Tax=Devosia ginsengisoli TaxID=400770 RepID=UPI0026F1B035|nr:tail protein X [Devosia ginsengisoli]MCR6672213.1 tail protein X [Devosia ginsengisoli]
MIDIKVQRSRTTLDLLLWRQHGIVGMAMLEETLELNPGVADLGAELPIGTSVQLPDLPAPAPVQVTKVIDLFGED